MKHFFLFCAGLVMTGTLLAPGAGHAQGMPGAGSYSLKTVEAIPIPRDEHLKLWREVALKQCTDARKRFNLAPDQCLQVIAAKADACSVKLAPETPEMVRTTAAAKDVGRKYLHCAVPYYFCKGVEVKSEVEVLAQCK
ncbi:hypothetical protein SAMN05216350_106260 [Polaromonas sp. YR568]|uniref:hypothetical protein n=1 Tax=Polaromonas sp. YR568 TaxID=1855301 RepID=UPI0008E11A89|nr:hypothetical protein [Polaromonas sp. YR568]SFU86100.1 hypothetical protein SAMN05216350_106260 [Polaromonas sp. YR568]